MTVKNKRVKKQNRYPERLKRRIAKAYLAGEASYSILAEENGLRDKNVVKEFVKWYKAKLVKEPDYALKMEEKKQGKQIV